MPECYIEFVTRDFQEQLQRSLGDAYRIERELGGGLTLGPQLIHTDNSSTLAPSDFRRTQLMVTARYRF